VHPELSIGELAARAGVSVPTIRFYESLGLVGSRRTVGNQRRFERTALRRLAVIGAGRRVGLSLAQIAAALGELPAGSAPTQADWTSFATGWRQLVDARIAELQALRADLDGCIGCGCLSLQRCQLFNRDDEAAGEGPGARWLRQAPPGG